MPAMSYFLIDPKYRRENLKKIYLEFTAYEIDLIIKCLSIGYMHFENELLLFNDKKIDKEKIFYLQRLLGCKANKCFHNIDNNVFFKLNLK